MVSLASMAACASAAAASSNSWPAPAPSRSPSPSPSRSHRAADAVAQDGRQRRLGLSTVYGVVARSGGSVSVQSEEGTGTVFHVYFPAFGAPPPAASSGPGLAGGKRILVVDDEPAMLAVVSRILSKNGYSVLEAHSGEEAVSVASSHNFDFDLLPTNVIMAS